MERVDINMKTLFHSKHLVIAALIMAVFAVAGCGGAANTNSGAKGKKVINIGVMNAPSGFNPLESTDLAQNTMTDILFKPLVQFDESMQHVPMLASSVETKDNQTFVVKLDEKAKWTDGKPVTADDVIFTVNLITNPKVASTIASRFAIIEGLDSNGKNKTGAAIAGVNKVDERTVTFKTKSPMDLTLFKEAIGTRLKTVPAHVLKDVDPEKLYQQPFMQKPTVTNGPFKLVAYQKGQYVQLEANKDYFKGAPKLDEIYFKIMPGASITAQLQSGEIDMNEPNLGMIPFEDTDKVKSMTNVTADSQGMQSTIQTLMFNMKTIPDVRVRKALSAAINRNMIVDQLLKGDGEAIELPYLSYSPYINKALLPLTPYDPAKAKQLLEEAGWDFNRTLDFDVPTGNKVREQVADIIVDNLKSIGVKAQIRKYDFVTSMATAKKGAFDIYIIGITETPATPDISNKIRTDGSLNLSGYSNQEVDNLLLTGQTEVDPDKRKAMYYRIQEIFAADLPCPGIYAQNTLKAVAKRVTFGKPKAFGMYNDLEKWDVQ